MVRQSECRAYGAAVLVKAAGEREELGQVGGTYCRDPFVKAAGVAWTRSQQIGEVTDEIGQLDHLRAGRSKIVTQVTLLFGQPFGMGEQEPG